MNRVIAALVVLTIILGSAGSPAARGDDFRPPAVPLVTHDPYFSVWSFGDSLTGGWTCHWTGVTQAMCGMVRVDGKPLRIAGMAPTDVPAMSQIDLQVWPTRTVYTFEGAGVRVGLVFMSPLLPRDLDVLGRPVTYVTWSVRSLDGKEHDVSLYLDCTAEWAVNTPDQFVNATRVKIEGLSALRVGTSDQRILSRAGDNLRIDWGYLYLACERDDAVDDVVAGHYAARGSFARDGRLPGTDDLRMPRAAGDDYPVLAVALDAGKVGAKAIERHVLLAYDDLYSIEHMQRRLRPYWRRGGVGVAAMLQAAARDYGKIAKRCAAFDSELMEDLEAVGDKKYAHVAALAYRQCLAAHKLTADWNGRPLMFSKECFSNGCIATVDVTYPASPLFLLLNPDLLKAQLTPVIEYAASDRWPHPFAPHDLGTYPLANRQSYGGSEFTAENQMPVEESGNMLLMLAAIAHVEGNADYALKYWSTISTWAEYLRAKGLDPEHQLCTDDFAGHLAHNANLSLKAILALGGYSRLCELAGKTDEAAEYRKAAEEMAGQWPRLADDGDHYRLAFDKPGTWSQKYNLVWDRVLGLGLFPQEVSRKEFAYYQTRQNRFGLPLDNRSTYTKLDWVVWTAGLAQTQTEFDALFGPVYDFVQQTPDRVPLTDWYYTDSGRRVGFQARSVVGAVYMPMLTDGKMLKKWANHGE